MKWDLSIRGRMAVGFGLILGLLFVLVGVTVNRLLRVGAEQYQLTHVIGERADEAVKIQTAFMNRSIALHSFIATRDAKYLQIFKQEQQAEQEAVARLRNLPASREGAVLRTRIMDVSKEFDRQANQVLALIESAAPAREIDPLENRLRDLRGQLIAATRDYSALQTRKRIDADTELDQLIGGTITQIALLAAGILIISVAAALLTIHAVRHPAIRLAAAIRALEEGDYGPARDLARLFPRGDGRTRSELHALAGAFGRMAGALGRRKARLVADNEVATLLAASLEPRRLAAGALGGALAFAGGQAGAIYLLEDGQLRLLARQGAIGAPPTLAAGEGLAGRALAEARAVAMQEAAAAPFLAPEGEGAAAEFCLAAAPILFQNRAGGVILMRCASEPGTDELEFLTHTASHLAISLQNALSHIEATRLAEELKFKNAQLRAQNEMLRAQQEQLQTQSGQLQAKNEEIQQQSEELQAQNEELQTVLGSLRESETTLRRQAAELAEADRRKDEFLAMLAHELRNPLAAISNANYVLAKCLPGTEQAERLRDVVTRQVRHLARMVDDLLDVSRITQGKVALRRTPVNLRRVMEEAVESCQATAGSRELTLEVAPPPEETTLKADATRLEQMICNLLSNAIKFTETGGTIRLSATCEGGWTVLRVSDNGMGIAPEILPHVFELFTQADSGPDRAKGGLGIGLTLVKTLAELHGGRVEAHSEGIGRGSEFVLRLPMMGNAE